MEFLALLMKYILIVFSLGGIFYHLLILKSPASSEKIEKRLGKEYGVKTRLVPKIEENNMELHMRLVKSKNYNILVIIFLILLLIVLVR
ncbi:MAG: hypothetical protein JW869_06045 [Candidatus Omnitrophica bacterium]|nr:hypothetical protein [Candidatus Omnitrophota bacterium]